MTAKQTKRTYKIDEAERQRDRFVVTAYLYENDKMVKNSIIKQAFPLEMSRVQIEKAIDKAAKLKFSEMDRAKENAEKDKRLARADQTAKELTNKEQTV